MKTKHKKMSQGFLQSRKESHVNVELKISLYSKHHKHWTHIKRLWLTILRCAIGWWSKAESQEGDKEGLDLCLYLYFLYFVVFLFCARGWWSKAERQVGHEEGLARWSKSTTQGSQAVLRGAGKGAEPPELAEVLMKLIYVLKLLRLFCIPCHVILVIS